VSVIGNATEGLPGDGPTLTGPVEVVGTGLLGTSIALALRRAGIEVLLTDRSPDHVRTASGLGAGRATAPGDRPQLVVVAVPPDHLGAVIRDALERTAGHGAVVTDVGSVKAGPLAAVAEVPGVERYVGGHPMAGSERSGPLAASAALFDGRPWAVTPHDRADADAVALVEQLVRLTGAVVVPLPPAEHDRAVARTSHVPHLLSSLVAGRLADAPEGHLALSGQGVRDVTRVAAGDPRLYGQIVSANAEAVLGLLGEVREQLDALIDAVAGADRERLETLLSQGVAGTRAIPGKHGGPVRPMRSVFVSVPDHPGELARLFAAAGTAEVNIEDVRIDHDPGRPVGLVELVVDETLAEQLLGSLESQGWVTHR
jgi:prephenate dehydrogenase